MALFHCVPCCRLLLIPWNVLPILLHEENFEKKRTIFVFITFIAALIKKKGGGEIWLNNLFRPKVQVIQYSKVGKHRK